MICNNSRNLLFIPVLLTILAVTSCQRELSFIDPGPVIEQLKDSTLLIKSITFINDDDFVVRDTVTESYSYDSVNRKVLIIWNSTTSTDMPDGMSEEISYNADWMVTRGVFTYPSGYTPGISDFATVDVEYDGQKILKKITTKYADGATDFRIFTKTMLSGGNYQLSWDETNPADPYYIASLRRAVFNAEGKNIISISDQSFGAGTSPSDYNNYVVSDTFSYDAAGNVSKIVRNVIDTLQHTNQSFLFYEFAGRETRGDQLYNQRQGLMRGIANMPFGGGDSDAGTFGLLSFGIDFENLQFLKYPVQTTKIYNWNNSNFTFNSSSEFDSKNRLVRFKGFFLDVTTTDRIFEIKYFK